MNIIAWKLFSEVWAMYSLFFNLLIHTYSADPAVAIKTLGCSPAVTSLPAFKMGSLTVCFMKRNYDIALFRIRAYLIDALTWNNTTNLQEYAKQTFKAIVPKLLNKSLLTSRQ